MDPLTFRALRLEKMSRFFRKMSFKQRHGMGTGKDGQKIEYDVTWSTLTSWSTAVGKKLNMMLSSF